MPSKSLQELRDSDQISKKWMRFFKKTNRKKVKEALSQKLDIKLQYIKPIFYNNKYNRKIAHEKGLPW